MSFIYSSYIFITLFLNYLTGDAWVHIAHHVVELLLKVTGGMNIGAPTADSLVRFSISTAQLTGRTDIHTCSAQAALLRPNIERRPDSALFSPPAEANSLGHHLLLAHPDA